eukprot:jgi/Mesvir1/4239/Mv22209-RA.1
MAHLGFGKPDLSGLHSLLVMNLSYRTDEETLLRLFEKYGKVMDVYRPRDARTKQPKAFGFVRFKTKEECMDAMRMDGRTVDDREIQVKYAKYGRQEERYVHVMGNLRMSWGAA